MGQIGQIIADAGRLGPLYAERLLNGVTQENYARLGSGAAGAVASNHAAFVLGHLCLYPPKIMQQLGQPAGETAAPTAWEELFKAGCECRHDPDGEVYPSLEQLRQRFFAGHGAALVALAEADDAALLAPNPNEGRSRELFPTVGAMFAFYVGGHVMTHLGQLSAWRRMMGLAAV